MTKAKGIDAISVALNDYSDVAREAMFDAVSDVMKESADKLHEAGSFKGKKYRRSWTQDVERTNVSVSGVTYNAKHYRLTHLLEYGHAKQNGGRTRAFEHIAPVNDWAQETVQDRFEDYLDELEGRIK